MGKFDREQKQFIELFNVAQYRTTKNSEIFYVDSNLGGDENNWSGRRFSASFPTIQAALNACTASRGDVILVSPYHTETVTSVMTISKAGVRIIGETLGKGPMSQRAVITVNGAIDLFSIEADGVELAGLKLTIATTDAATALVNVAAANAHVHDLYLIPSATSVNVVDAITVTSAGSELVLENILIFNKVVAVNSFLSLEGAASNVMVRNFKAFGDCVTAGIIDAAKIDYLWLENVTVGTVGTTIPAVILDSNPEGVAIDVDWLGTHTTIASNANMGNLMRIARQYVLEATDASVQATNIIPALDTE